MSHQIRGFFKRITGEQSSYDALAKQPITDAETKLKLFNDSTSISVVALEVYLKSVSKLIDQTLSERLNESKDQFSKYDKPNDQIMGTVLGKMSLIQSEMNNDVTDFIRNVEFNVLKPLMDYQEELKVVKENKKELKDAYDKIEQCRQNSERYRKEAESASRSGGQAFRISTSVEKKSNDIMRLEDKVSRCEKDMDEATSTANEKYDKYTETLYKRISEECELSNNYVHFLNAQRKFHKRALKKLDLLIPDVDEAIHTYYKKPVFGSDLEEYVERSRAPGSAEDVSPVIKKLIHSMYAQNAFEEEGIFRIAGSRVKMNCLLNAINCGYLDCLDTTHDFDVHCLAGVLKQYIRELPDSLLCNDFYEDWIQAIGTSPLPNKLEAYKKVLTRIPKINRENIRYLIKFLSKIVENSDKTKMTTSNMGICFGVSLLSSNGPFSNNTFNKSSDNVIDMATATNVFDFLLTNHKELFEEDIDFSKRSNNNPNKSNHNSLPKASSAGGGSNNEQPANSCKITDSPFRLKNQNINTEEDSISELQNPATLASSPFQRNSAIFANTGNVSSVSRHFKKPSMDNEFSASNNSINSVGSVGNFNGSKAMSSPSQNSTEPGSLSPRRERGKKMAPAPPPVMRNPANQTNSDLNNSYLGNVSEIQTSPPKIPSSAPAYSTQQSTGSSSNKVSAPAQIEQSSDVSKQPALFPKLSSNQSVTSILSTLRIGNNDVPIITEQHQQQQSPLSISPKSQLLEKPTHPPPSLPNRPPPIGFFNIAPTESSPPKTTTETSQQKLASNSNSNLLSCSSSSSSSQEMLNAQTLVQQINQNQTPPGFITTAPISKGPKPAVPRRPGNMILAHVNKFDQHNVVVTESNSGNSQVKCQTLNNNKSSSEITSL